MKNLVEQASNWLQSEACRSVVLSSEPTQLF